MNTAWPSVRPQLIWREPEDDWQVVCTSLAAARQSIAIPIYEMGGPPVTEALCAAKSRGVEICVLFNGQFYVGNNRLDSRYDQVYAVIDALVRAPGNGSLAFVWSANNFSITHQKTILIDATRKGKALPAAELSDSARALVLTMNLCRYAWMTSDQGSSAGLPFPMPWQFWGPAHPHMKGFPLRDFGAVLTDRTLVAQIAAIFASDFQGPSGNETNSLASSQDGLVWSNGSTGLPNYYPNGGSYPSYGPSTTAGAVDQGNARAVLLQLINAAQQTLMVYNEEMADAQIVSAIAAAAQRGVQVRILLTGNVQMGDSGTPVYESASQYSQLAAAGVTIRLFVAGPDHMYIHAKVLLADAGGESAIAFMGSQNISGNSLNFNRELGIQLAGEEDTALFIETFNSDWSTEGLVQWPAQGPNPTPAALKAPLPIYNPSASANAPMPQGPIARR